MKVAVFISGRSFYTGWRDATQGRRINFESMAEWLAEHIGAQQVIGINYFTALDASGDRDQSDKLVAFLEVLELQPGFHVRKVGRRSGRVQCGDCGADVRVPSDIEADTLLVASALQLAAVDAFDAALFVSISHEHVPAIESLATLGKPSYVASWGQAGVSHRVRKAAHQYIDLNEGLEQFAEDGDDDAFWDDDALYDETCQIFLDELRAAERKFQGGYVGLGYFVTKWRSTELSPSPDIRRKVLEDLIETGDIEAYEATDGAQAIRVQAT